MFVHAKEAAVFTPPPAGAAAHTLFPYKIVVEFAVPDPSLAGLTVPEVRFVAFDAMVIALEYAVAACTAAFATALEYAVAACTAAFATALEYAVAAFPVIWPWRVTNEIPPRLFALFAIPEKEVALIVVLTVVLPSEIIKLLETTRLLNTVNEALVDPFPPLIPVTAVRVLAPKKPFTYAFPVVIAPLVVVSTVIKLS